MNSQKSIRRALCILVVTVFMGTWSSVSRGITPSQLGICSATATSSYPYHEDKLHRLSNFSDTQTILDANETVSDSPANKLTVTKSSSCGVLWGDDTRPLRILVTCSDQYFPVFMNWLVHYHHICPIISNIFFICLDKGVEGRLFKIGLQCSHLFPYTTGYHKLWLARVRITQSLMRQGYDVLMTDVDAVWLRNPFHYIEKHIRQSDIIGTVRYSMLCNDSYEVLRSCVVMCLHCRIPSISPGPRVRAAGSHCLHGLPVREGQCAVHCAVEGVRECKVNHRLHTVSPPHFSH